MTQRKGVVRKEVLKDVWLDESAAGAECPEELSILQPAVAAFDTCVQN